MLNCSVTREDVRRADAIFGVSVASLKGKTNKLTSVSAKVVLAPRVTQLQQVLSVDIFFVKKLVFLLGVLSPLGLSQCAHLKDKSVLCVSKALNSFCSTASSRGCSCSLIQTDGEGAIGAMVGELNASGLTVEIAGPGQHVPVVERIIQTVKKRVRAFNYSLPFIMTRILIIMCVLFCVSRINLQASSTATDKTSPLEQFTGRKLDAKRDLRVQFGDYIQATVPVTDNSMTERTQGCIALLPTGNLTGSVKMLCLATNAIVTRDQFVVLPMPDIVTKHITLAAETEGYSRSTDPMFDCATSNTTAEEEKGAIDEQPKALPEMIDIDNRIDSEVLPVDNSAVDRAVPGVICVVDSTIIDVTKSTDEHATTSPHAASFGPRSSTRVNLGRMPTRYSETGVDQRERILVLHSAADAVRADIRKQLVKRADWIDSDFAFTMSVRAAMRDRGDEARPVIIAELEQMIDTTKCITILEKLNLIWWFVLGQIIFSAHDSVGPELLLLTLKAA